MERTDKSSGVIRPKIMTVYGTRPEAIKVAPVIAELQNGDTFDSVAVSTGQHKEMLEQVNSMFGIVPAYNLDLMRPGQSLNQLVARALKGIDEVIVDERPDVIISQGDTSTAMAAALAGFNRQIKVVHLEAGLRTGNIMSPYPEEGNRKLIAQVAALHLAPTSQSKENLLRENTPEADIAVTGNTVIDALLHVAEREVKFDDPALAEVVASDRRVVLVTTHRRENLEAMSGIGEAIAHLSASFPEVVFVLPLHLNPLVRDVVIPLVEDKANVLITDPLSYDQFTAVMKRSCLVVTDSGGVQEEAPSLGKPVLVMRDTTERPEAVDAGTVRLIGTASADIIAHTTELLTDDTAYHAMANAVNPYGDGQAAKRAVAAIAELLGVGKRLPDFAA